MGRIASSLQRTVTEFMKLSNWTVTEGDTKTLVAQKRIGGNEWSWTFHFEDEKSISQAGSPTLFAGNLSKKAESNPFFDLIVTDKVTDTRHWKDYLSRELSSVLSARPNRRYGTVTEFLNRFATEVSEACALEVNDRLKVHFVKSPLKPFFTSGESALNLCGRWVGKPDLPRIMLVTGDPGAGKSVFALMLVRELRHEFSKDPNRNPAPFLIWFERDRPARIPDLIALTLSDIGLAQSLTPDAIGFLLAEGRLVLILDGFDEVSRALAHNAEENIEQLSKSIHGRKLGRLILTTRPSFVVQEDIFTNLKSSCEQEKHEQYHLAPYTDEQMGEWVVGNPPEGAPSPPARHWQRVETAFRQNPAIKELCRTPVFLRMMSEVLVSRPSVKSLFNLLEEFCLRMWERERSKRTLTLSDPQYFYAYEAISVAVDDESRIQPKEVKTILELYLDEYSPDLLAGLPGEDRALVEDLSIGPLTFKNGIFVFSHELLTGFFLARMMIRKLLSRKNINELWNRPIKDTVWRFLPEVVMQIGGEHIDSEKIVREVALPSRSGLLTWNIIRALDVPKESYPPDLFRGKRLAGIIFDGEDLRGLSFDGAELLDVSFVKCGLEGTTFRSTTVRKAKLVECGKGALIDESLQVDDNSELLIMRGSGIGSELYTGEDIRRVLREMCEDRTEPIGLPPDVGKQATVLIFSSLFRSDMRSLDYPEWTKIENRIRGWTKTFGLSEEITGELSSLLLRMAVELRDEKWISRNPSRPRTFVPSPKHQRIISEIVRLQKVRGSTRDLEGITRDYQEKIRKILERQG